MHDGMVTNVRIIGGETNTSSITIALHQKWASSSNLSTSVIDDLTRDIQDKVPWCMLFVHHIVLINETRVRTNYEIYREKR